MKKFGVLLLVILGLVILAVTIGPFLVPIPPLKDTVPPEALADPDSRFIEVDGLSVHYKEVGQGEPALILLHGFAASLFSWREVLGTLGQGRYLNVLTSFCREGCMDFNIFFISSFFIKVIGQIRCRHK